MEKSPLPKFIKLKLEQPALMCSGRKKVECYYRATIISISKDGGRKKLLEFKSHGTKVQVEFLDDVCTTEGWEDLKIYK